MPEELEVLLKGPKNDHQVHIVGSQGGKERRSSKERGNFPDKVPITFTFNALHQLNRPH